MTIPRVSTGYGAVSIVLHWLGAALIGTLFILGNRMEDLPRGPDLTAARDLHVAVGVLAFTFLALRIVWRLANPREGAEPGRSGLLDKVARAVQIGLVATIAVLIVTGPLSIWANARPLEVFGLFTLPSPLPRIAWLHEGTEVVHAVASKVILLLVGLHVLGALKHLIIDRDGVMRRMLVPVRTDGRA